LQINISEETTKSGILLKDLATLIEQVLVLPQLKLRGVMAIPAPTNTIEAQRLPYRNLFNAVQQLNKPQLDTFSFGMSDDLEAAIAEGATIVRIGTALFGARAYN
jgi:pyridoxal phosphate enzyme (YggS family)